MSELERDTERRITTLESNVNNLIAELRDFKTEMRDRDNQRAAAFEALRQKHEADMARLSERHEADMARLNERIESKFDKLSRQIQNLTIAAVVGIGAIVIGGGAVIWSAISTLK